jgi:chemotaxis protein methyltransferase WspC
MTQAAIETLLKQKIGLEADSIGSGTVARAIQQRMIICSAKDVSAYLKHLQTSAQELEELIEAVVVPETWFFRDKEPFICLTRYVLSEWLPANPGGILRVLSLPCATGEEPYSIAISLLETGLLAKQFEIDAIDISKKALQKARQAVYRQNSFRGEALEFRDRYFSQTSNGYQLHDWVRKAVNFIHGNLRDSYLLIDKKPYDIVFCRNVLIYFDDFAKAQTLRTLERLLKPQGILFVGHAEATHFLASQFISVRHPLAFAYRKPARYQENFGGEEKTMLPSNSTVTSARSTSPVPTNNTPKNSISDTSLLTNFPYSGAEKYRSQEFEIKKNLVEKKLPEASDKSSIHILQTARHLADQGELSQAVVVCEACIQQHRTNAEAYVLLGQIHQADGRTNQAEQWFQKALYLDPNHYEALTHLLLLKEQRGEFAAAKLLRQRIQRLGKGEVA